MKNVPSLSDFGASGELKENPSLIGNTSFFYAAPRRAWCLVNHDRKTAYYRRDIAFIYWENPTHDDQVLLASIALGQEGNEYVIGLNDLSRLPKTYRVTGFTAGQNLFALPNIGGLGFPAPDFDLPKVVNLALNGQGQDARQELLRNAPQEVKELVSKLFGDRVNTGSATSKSQKTTCPTDALGTLQN